MAGLDLQLKVRQNAEELGDFLKDLDRWETDIKKKDEDLKSSETILKKSLPPVRNQRRKKKMKKKELSNKDVGGPKRISSYDYNAWDNFDVEEELKKLDMKEEMETMTSSEEDTSDEEQIEEERRLQKALLDKDKGNSFFKEGKYEQAIHCYTSAIQLDPRNAVLPANRAMALIKLQRFGAAEEDCNTAIALDSSYTKAYLRRGAARAYLKKLKESMTDYEQALKLEPENKQALQEIAKLKKRLENGKVLTPTIDSQNITAGKYKKPFKRIEIDEIGSDSSEEDNAQQKPCPTKTNSDDEEKTTDGFDIESADDKEIKNNRSVRKIVHISSSPEPVMSSAERHETQVKEKKQEIKCNVSAAPKNTGIKNKTYEIPKNSIQLEKDWKELKNRPGELFDYFKKINPKSYSKLFQQAIDSNMLSSIITILNDYYIPAKLPVYNELECLAQVQRFSMMAMFFSSEDKEALQNLFTYVKGSSGINGPSLSEITAIMKKYYL